ncbi:hypothetical protein KQX54_011227 [Cotesia glomerata]|uniref:Uncharacterized protein n=1 Tax=Cotesia glomerata TaxID=32391 RepID=A0AAV7J2Z6_COTGL|nr:hypothetical protein KQX54_011227 [Cotesia glomerata]
MEKLEIVGGRGGKRVVDKIRVVSVTKRATAGGPQMPGITGFYIPQRDIDPIVLSVGPTARTTLRDV